MLYYMLKGTPEVIPFRHGLSLVVYVLDQPLLLHVSLYLCVCVFVVMSFPAEGVESAIKNNIEDVRLFLDSRHAGHYAVYNLSKRSYRPSRFHNRV